MTTILARLNDKFRILQEQHDDTSWKDPNSPEYDRQVAEDGLFHTIGPLLDNPRWTDKWTSSSEPVPGFTPGGPAPRWTPDEIVFAFAGDPELLFSGPGNPRSPQYGNRGGSPLYRAAKRVSRIYRRDNDRSFIADMYSNGFVPLVQMMHPGYDEARSPFISYVLRNVVSAMEHGFGGEQRTSRAAGSESITGLRGIGSLLGETDPAKVREAANAVKGQYQTTRSHDKNPDNPFGPFSSAYYQTVMAYADALESGDPGQVEAAKSRLNQLVDQIEEYSIPVRGASTGMGQAVSTPSRNTSVGVSSIDVSTGGAEGREGSMAGNIAGTEAEEPPVDTETIKYILDIALNYDLGATLSGSKRYQEMAASLGADKIGGKMTVNELRYIIRTLGAVAADYPGRGTMRANTDIPRDSKNWWSSGEDPEIEPIPGSDGGIWHSIWTRSGFESMGPTPIADEMTEEVREFNKLGIHTARQIKAKQKATKTRVEVVSKVAVANTIRAATVKLRIIAHIHRADLGVEESKQLRAQGLILESLDAIDLNIVCETCDWMVRKINRAIVLPQFQSERSHRKTNNGAIRSTVRLASN